jgi:Uma2 family endonuclease
MATQLIASDTTDNSRFERIDGQWVARPVPTIKHAQLQKRVLNLLDETIKEFDPKPEVLAELSIDQPEYAQRDDPNYMTADVLVAYPPLKNAKSGHLSEGGFLAVEVLSPGQSLFDKAERYYAWGIPHIWIIDPNTRDCFEFHGGRQFTVERETLHAGSITISVRSIFEGI